jgi:hypothetical protein
MSRCRVATSRFACSWPPLKIGMVIDGRKLHAAEPPLNRPPSDELAVPRSPVRLMVGKNAARAAPMFAFAARSWARRNVGEDLLIAQCHGRRQVRGQRLAQQQHEPVLDLRAPAHLRRAIRLRLLHHRLRLAHRELVAGAGLELPPRQVVRRLRGLQREVGDMDELVEREHREVLVCHLRHEQDLERLARLCAGEVLLQRRVAQAAEAPEEIDLPGDRRRHGIRVLHDRRTARREALGRARRRAVGRHAHLRKQRRALDAVLRAHLLDVQRRDAQVAVVRERDLDQPLQARIAEELAPPDLDRGPLVG